MKKKVIIYDRIEEPVLSTLKEEFDVQIFKEQDAHKDPDFLPFLQETEGIIGLDFPGKSDVLDQAPNLKIISNVSVGYNNLDTKELTKRNIMGTNTPDVLTDTVADMAMGLMLSTARRMPELDQYVKQGRWKEAVTTELFGADVHHKTLGIIGMGRIGKAIAQRAHLGFNMDILYHSRTPKPDAEEQFNALHMNLENLLRSSDYVCLITPLTDETKGMIGEKEFQIMKPSAIFINVSRGSTVVEADLIEALKNEEIAAAGLDVYVEEPVDPDNELLKMDNVVTLPHIGSATLETEIKMAELAAKNLRAGLNGEKPGNLVNPEVWKKE
ncbi:2-hydroxyacid dehydrogenase [Oceanobacillus alkalisoli]|uniref:2-hydroxyacid dehydrogenase n=1 Tax=Oceanobacillus alkalisoli TaxID=2925113 RepID=UPI001F12103A|nr:D-glycerate dehydrogenase [Oceanobacillus alkalisoli]MCF3943036.1 D-glycerate dehydrogenase [Oceanobacillus alkalisoli]